MDDRKYKCWILELLVINKVKFIERRREEEEGEGGLANEWKNRVEGAEEEEEQEEEATMVALDRLLQAKIFAFSPPPFSTTQPSRARTR